MGCQGAFREVTSGFCKGTVPGAPPCPSPEPLRMPKNNFQKRRARYHPRGTSWWRTCEVTLRSCRGTVPGAPPSPYTRPQECPKILLQNRTWYQTRKHDCAKARLRNPEFWKNFIQEPQRTHEAKKSHEQHQRIFWTIRRGYRSLPSKTRVSRQITPESSPERSPKSLSHGFFVAPFLSPSYARKLWADFSFPWGSEIQRKSEKISKRVWNLVAHICVIEWLCLLEQSE